jgi:leader peptidase (prepilin peptidase)/N-methyltransferase
MFSFYWLLVALAISDAENFWLPDRLTYPGIALGFAVALAKAVLEALSPIRDTVNRTSVVRYQIEKAAIGCITAILLAAGLILLIRWLYKLIRKREGIGLGDAKLMAMLAAWLGLPGALLSFFLAVTLGTLVALIVLALPSARTKDEGWALRKLPLGTFLCAGGIVSALWGQPIIAAYLHLAGL